MQSKLESSSIKKAIFDADLSILSKYPGWQTALLDVPELALKDNKPLFALHYAATINRLSVIKWALDSNPELINSVDANNQTLVCIACVKNDLPMLEYLITKKADLNIPSAFNSESILHHQTPIIWAAMNGHLEVVQRLISAGVDFNKAVNGGNAHLVHIASQFGYLKMLEYFLEKDSSLLDRLDKDGSSPLEWAAMKGRNDIADYLLTASQLPGGVTISPMSIMRSYKVAMQRRYYRFAGIILLNSLGNNRYTAIIIPYVVNALFAMELMRLDPKLIKILMGDADIAKKLAEQGAIIERTKEGTIVKCYKTQGRRKSLILIANGVTEQIETYEPTKNLGRGSYAYVRLFKSADNKEIAVRAPFEHYKEMSPSNLTALESKLKHEVLITCDLYNDTVGDYFLMWIDDENWTTRQLMQYVEGENLKAFTMNLLSHNEAAKITLKIAEELERVHNLGVILGDLNPDNIMIIVVNKNYKIRFVDLGDSYYLSSPTATLRNLTKNERAWYPPEICNGGEAVVKPATSQNVYSFGYILDRVWGMKNWKPELLEKYPSIANFITTSTNIIPNMRGNLPDFISQLSSEIVKNLDESLTAVKLI